MTFISLSQALTGSIEEANDAYQQDDGLAGLSTGFRALDHALCGLRGGELVVVAGRPSMGKTALVLGIAGNVARARARRLSERPQGGSFGCYDGAVVGIFAFEMKAKWIASRLLSDLAEIPTDKIRRGLIDEGEFRRLVKGTMDLENVPIFIDDSAETIADIAERTKQLQQDRGLGLLVVDYVQLVQGAERQGEGRFQEIQEITAALKALAMSLDIPVIAVSQLSRALEARDDKRPQLTDLLGAGSLENDADTVMFVFREEYYVERAKPDEGTHEFQHWMKRMQDCSGKAEIIVSKHRNGPVGTIDLQFDNRYTRFSELAQDAPPAKPRGGLG
jgi:replicative DNA helicase